MPYDLFQKNQLNLWINSLKTTTKASSINIKRIKSLNIEHSFPTESLEELLNWQFPVFSEIEIAHETVDFLVSKIESELLKSNNNFIEIHSAFPCLVDLLNERN